MNRSSSVTITPIQGVPLVKSGDDLGAILLNALSANALTLNNGDVLVISSKIVSKAEGKRIALSSVSPSEDAYQVAHETHKDPRIVELVLQESTMISRKAPYVLVTRHRLGFVSANAGIDQSNIEDGDGYALLLPDDPDHTAETLHQYIRSHTGADVGIVISDSHGRPFREGNVGVAVGVHGLPALADLRGDVDLFGRTLRVSVQGYADLVASAAHLVSGEGGEGIPAVLIRGLRPNAPDGCAADLYRDPENDLYLKS